MEKEPNTRKKQLVWLMLYFYLFIQQCPWNAFGALFTQKNVVLECFLVHFSAKNAPGVAPDFVTFFFPMSHVRAITVFI